MSDNKIQSLVNSLEILRESVVKAEILVQQVDPRSKIMSNLASYLAVCNQQIEFAKMAQIATEEEEGEKALNYIHLIEKLADLVKEDAESLLGNTSTVQFDRSIAH